MAAHSRQQEESHEDLADDVDGSEREMVDEPEEKLESSALVIVDTPVQSPVSSGRRGRRRVSSGGVITLQFDLQGSQSLPLAGSVEREI